MAWANRFSFLFAVISAITVPASRGGAQGVVANPFGFQDPSRAVTSNVMAQSELMRAYAGAMSARGDLANKFAQARLTSAQAATAAATARIERTKAGVFNVESYWYLQDLWDAKVVERRGTYLNNAKAKNKTTWDLLQNHPDLIGKAVTDGRALNFLLNRLSDTLLAYNFSGKLDQSAAGQFPSQTLTLEQLRGLQLRQPGEGNEQLVFQADGTGAIEKQQWPYILRTKEFDAQRAAFEKARDAAISEAGENMQISAEALQSVEREMQSLAKKFFTTYPPGTWTANGVGKMVQIRAAETFLRDLDRKVRPLQSVGDVRAIKPAFYDPKTDGKSLFHLLSFMARNGVEFAPATPGDEPVYHQAYKMMQDVYTGFAANDPGLQPGSLDELLMEKSRLGSPKGPLVRPAAP